MRELDRRDQSLIMYLEACQVDRPILVVQDDGTKVTGGAVDSRKLSQMEMSIARGWHHEGWILFKRVPAAFLEEGKTHYVALSEEALQTAHAARLQRIKDHGGVPYQRPEATK